MIQITPVLGVPLTQEGREDGVLEPRRRPNLMLRMARLPVDAARRGG